MIGRAPARREQSRWQLALWGVLGLVGLVTVAIGTTAYGAGALSGDPEVTAEITTQAAAVPVRAPIEYQGVVVGTVTDVQIRTSGSTVTMRINERHADAISAGAQVRVLPRTLFGDLYVDMVPGEESGADPIQDGDRLDEDTSPDAVQLYDAFEELTSLLAEVDPAQINTALAAVSDFLRGRGERFGEMLDDLHAVTDDMDDLLAMIDEGAQTMTEFAEQAVDAAPDGVRALRNTVEISQMLVPEQDTVRAMLTSGIELTGETSRLARSENVDRFVELVRTADPVVDELADNPSGPPEAVRSMRELVEVARPTLQEGPWFRIRANLTAVEPYPYTEEDCPRYPGQEGPNCPDGQQAPHQNQQQKGQQGERENAAAQHGGASGPVGSAQERETLRELMGAAPENLPAAGDEDADGAVGVLLGPLVRGTQVSVP